MRKLEHDISFIDVKKLAIPEKKLLAIYLDTQPKTILNFIVYPGIVPEMNPDFLFS